MSNFTVGVSVTGDAAGLAKAAQEAKKALDSMAAAGVKDAQAINQAVAKTGSLMATNAARSQRDFARMAQARETLGVRSEHRIQQEVRRTQAAYDRLASSGTLTWREQRRAAEQMRETIGRLNAEMGVYSGRQRVAAGLQRAGLLAAGVVAGAAVVAPKVARAFSYDRQLANMANTAYGDPSKSAEEDRAARFAGMKEMDQAIRAAGGGSTEAAAETLNSLLSSGRFKPQDSLRIFKEAVRAATANDASGQDFAQIAFAANASMGVKPEDMARVFGATTYAGQSGAFEVKDMAKSLPAQFGFAQSIGLAGLQGVAKLAALNQASRLTAGTSDQAATNTQNLLAKIGSQDTRTNFTKLGINYDKRLAEGRMKGLDALDVTANIVEEQLAKNKNYRAAIKAYQQAATDSDRKEALGGVLQIAKGSVVSKLFPDMQAQSALVGFLADRENVSRIARESLQFGPQAVDRNMWTVEASPGYKIDQAKQAAEFANYDAMIKLGPAVSSAADAFTNLAGTYPGFTAAISAATTALQGLAVAAGAIGLGGALLGGKAIASGAGGAASRAFGAGARAIGGAAGAVTDIAATGAGVVAGSGLAAGAALVAIPAVGAYAYDQMTNTEGGLRARIADRNARLAEYDQLLAAKRDAGDSPVSINRVQAERDAMAASRDDMTQRLEAFLANSRVGGEITVNVNAAPGVQAQTELKPNDGTRMTGNVGRTNGNTD